VRDLDVLVSGLTEAQAAADPSEQAAYAPIIAVFEQRRTTAREQTGRRAGIAPARLAGGAPVQCAD